MKLKTTTMVLVAALAAALLGTAHAHDRGASLDRRIHALYQRIRGARQQAASYRRVILRADGRGLRSYVRQTAVQYLADVRSEATRAAAAERDARRYLMLAEDRICTAACRETLFDAAARALDSAERAMDQAWFRVGDLWGQVYFLRPNRAGYLARISPRHREDAPAEAVAP